MRLKNSSNFKRKIDEELRLKMICRPGFIDELTKSIKSVYDPIHKIKTEYDISFYGDPEEKQKRKIQGLKQEITKYKAKVMNPQAIDINIYNTIS